MNKPDRRLDQLLSAAREAPPLLSHESTDNLLDFADKKRLTVVGLAFLHWYTGIATAAVSVAIGASTVFVYVNRETLLERHPGKSDRPAAMASPAPSLQAFSVPDNAPSGAASAASVDDRSALVQPSRVAPVALAGHGSHISALTPDQGFMERGASPTLALTPAVGELDHINQLVAPGSYAVGIIPLLPAASASTETPRFHDTPLTLSSEDEGWAFFAEAGSVYAALRGGFRNRFRGTSLGSAPQNFGAAAGGGGFHVAAGVSVPVTPWLRAMGAVRVSQFTSTYSSPDLSFVQSGSASHTMVPVQLEHNLALTIGAITLAPAVRLEPFTLPVYFDAGLAAGIVAHQAADYSTTIIGVPAQAGSSRPSIPDPVHVSNIGQARVQWNIELGIGTEIPVSPMLSIDAQLRGEYGLVPLFADNYPRTLSLTPAVGVRFIVP